MKKAITLIVALVIGAVVCLALPSVQVQIKRHRHASNEYVRNQVLKLLGQNGGQCSAVAIRIHDKPYILSAAHCRLLLTGNTLLAVEEDGSRHGLTMVKIDKDEDLMLLSGLPMSGVSVSSRDARSYDEVRIIAHGAGHMTYASRGELLEEAIVELIGIEGEPVSTLVEWTSAHVVGGCSGGPAVDDSGDLIGIVSLGNETFSGIVPLHVIKDFLKDVK